MLGKMIRMGELLDRYGLLLTERQREMCDLHYLQDFSLAEIAELHGVSRQAVHDTLARAERSMEGYEQVFALVAEGESRERRLVQLDESVSAAISAVLAVADHTGPGAAELLEAALAELTRAKECIASLSSENCCREGDV